MNRIDEIERAYSRRVRRAVRLAGEPARAAVGVLLEPRPDEPYVFFIHRAEHDQDPWSGHMGFPGGFRESTDETLEHTVRREVLEEVGVDLERHARLVGPLDEIQGVARGRELPLVISPFLYVLKEPVELWPNEEVQAILWVPLSYLEDERNESVIEPTIRGQRMRLPAFVYEGKTIWGLTFRMIRDFTSWLRAA